jgi:hypothetical protein
MTMVRRALSVITSAIRGTWRAIRARPAVFGAIALSVVLLNLVLPAAVLSLFRKRVDFLPPPGAPTPADLDKALKAAGLPVTVLSPELRRVYELTK